MNYIERITKFTILLVVHEGRLETFLSNKYSFLSNKIYIQFFVVRRHVLMNLFKSVSIRLKAFIINEEQDNVILGGDESGARLLAAAVREGNANAVFALECLLDA